MISYIVGVVDTIETDKIILDNNGIGYGIFMPQNSLELLGEGEEIKIYTYFSVREDAMQLFGFLTKEELRIFKMLIAVSGVGPKGAISIISACPGDNLVMAVISGDAKAISKAQGIGSKTAQRIIIELKDKLDTEDFTGGASSADLGGETTQAGSIQSDAIEALTSLGYSRTDSFNAVKKVKNSDSMDVEELLKNALKYMI